jgi:hypothetical protein
LVRSKEDLLELEKLEIKYGFEDLKKMNHFLHSNFFSFEMGFEKNWGSQGLFLTLGI